MLIKAMHTNYHNITTDWKDILSEEFKKLYFLNLEKFLLEEEKKFIIHPKKKLVFSALNYTSFANTKVVIIGQDPYHNHNQANGLAFSVILELKHPLR